MSIEVRQMVLQACVRRDRGEGDDAEDDHEEGASRKQAPGSDKEDNCTDLELLREEILAACRALVHEELRGLRER